jgi:hypothetical protein
MTIAPCFHSINHPIGCFDRAPRGGTGKTVFPRMESDLGPTEMDALGFQIQDYKAST